MAGGELAGRRLLVTGGGSGIGRAVVAALAAAGAGGVVIDQRLAAAHPAGWSGRAVDVRDDAGVEAAVREAADHLGGLDGVVACAGVVPSWQPPAELDLADLDRVLAVNVRGVAATIKHTAPKLAPGSTIVAMASVNAWRGDANLLSYTASKHAVLGLVRSAALALGPSGVRVNAVAPGPVATEALRQRITRRAEAGGPSVARALELASAATALGRIATEADVADAVVFLTSPRSRAITGHLLPVDGGVL